MNINNLVFLEQLYPTSSSQPLNHLQDLTTDSLSKDNQESFSNILTDSITKLDETQVASDHAIQGLVSGEADDIHNVMIQTTEAQLSLELAVQLRNRALEAMNEIKNMQF